MKITLEFDYDDSLARAVAIQNGGRGLAGPHEMAEWAKDILSVYADMAVQEMRESMEEGEPS
jgi:hypothetical protein